MSKQRLNIDLFKKVRDRIASIPESYDQDSWIADSKRSPCGTVACLAGETIICAAPTVEEGIKELHRLSDEESVPDTAASLLGLEGDFCGYDQSEAAIFQAEGRGFPEPYRSRYRSVKTYEAKAAVAILLLDHIIETGKVLE